MFVVWLCIQIGLVLTIWMISHPETVTIEPVIKPNYFGGVNYTVMGMAGAGGVGVNYTVTGMAGAGGSGGIRQYEEA
ncbi:MAG TPA: hypothetical protein PK205_07065 [Promineifilum sp.]|nr:hypothetical protein [Promineifilum sp.]